MHRQQLGGRYYALSEAVADLAGRVVRASSLVENVNSRLRNYFLLRRHLGSDYLALLQFFLNHRRFLRSEQQERVGKSPAELLSGQEHSHWLEMLGYQRFRRAAGNRCGWLLERSRCPAQRDRSLCALVLPRPGLLPEKGRF